VPRPIDPALEDALTGLSNERHFEILYEFAFRVAERGIPLCLATFEIDAFDRFTRERGPVEAEKVVEEFGAVLRNGTRRMDVTARLVGSRCASLLLDCNLQGGMVFADRILGLAEGVTEAWGLVVNAGLAAYEPEMEGRPRALRDGAEAALREAATQGGGTVAVHRGG